MISPLAFADHFGFLLPVTLLYMVCCVFKATNLVNNYRPRKSARTFASRQKASNKLYTVLAIVYLYKMIQKIINFFTPFSYIHYRIK
jgi:hypothetical protein